MRVRVKIAPNPEKMHFSTLSSTSCCVSSYWIFSSLSVTYFSVTRWQLWIIYAVPSMTLIPVCSSWWSKTSLIRSNRLRLGYQGDHFKHFLLRQINMFGVQNLAIVRTLFEINIIIFYQIILFFENIICESRVRRVQNVTMFRTLTSTKKNISTSAKPQKLPEN